MEKETDDILTLWGAFKMSLKAISILFLVIGFLMLFSCNAVKKSTTRTETKTDSTGTASKDSSRVIKADSTGTKTEQGNYEKLTVYAYDTIYYVEPGRTDTIIKYVPRIITIYEKGTYNKQETASKSNVDSGGVKQDRAAKFKKEVKQEQKDKKSSRFPWWIGVVIVIAGLLAVSWRRYFK